MGIEDYTTEDLMAELRQRLRRKSIPDPAWKCQRCGRETRFIGPYTPARFEMQAYDWERQHRDCAATWMGGGI